MKSKQTEMVLDALREAGDHGITQRDLMLRGILRLASRIHDLRQEGHTIISERKHVDGTTIAVYRLVEEPQATLFEVETNEEPQRVAAYF